MPAVLAAAAAGHGTHFAPRGGMSSERRKKDGKDPGKKRQRMREDQARRHAAAGPERPQRDEDDTITYKLGSAGDRTRVGAP
jgi:hypothetical protein